jgi:hypothetical protein
MGGSWCSYAWQGARRLHRSRPYRRIPMRYLAVSGRGILVAG